MSTSIPPEVAAHVLYHFGHGGYPAGSFIQTLLKAIAIADSGNLDRIARGFPEYVAAVQAISYDPDGVAHLRRIAEGAE